MDSKQFSDSVPKLNSIQFMESLLKQERGFKIEKPWRYNGKSLTCVVPITRNIKSKRPYLILSETKNVKIEETGNINAIKVVNDDKKPIYIRVGEIFAGDTQERSSIKSRIIMSGDDKIIEVRCIHASKGIVDGKNFNSDGYAPYDITRSVYKNDSQADVWNSVSHYSNSLGGLSSSYMAHTSSLMPDDEERNAFESKGMEITRDIEATAEDNLVDGYKNYSKLIEKVLKKVPVTDNQTGHVLIDKGGFYSLETFDVPSAWKAARKNVVKGAGVKLTDFLTEGVFNYKPEKAQEEIQHVLKGEFDQTILFRDDNSEILKLDRDKFIGEATLFNEDVIHLLLMRE